VRAQHRTLPCLSDVVDYFVAKAGQSARPLHVDVATLQLEATSPVSAAASRLHTGTATVGRTPFTTPHAATSSSSTAFSQFVYSNPAAMTPPSVGSSDTSPSSSSSPSHNPAATITAAAAAGGTVTSLAVSGLTHAATAENVSAHSMNSRLITFFTVAVYLSFFPRLISAAADWMSTILRHMAWP